MNKTSHYYFYSGFEALTFCVSEKLYWSSTISLYLGKAQPVYTLLWPLDSVLIEVVFLLPIVSVWFFRDALAWRSDTSSFFFSLF